jgi:DnaJ-class molecular chaperone
MASIPVPIKSWVNFVTCPRCDGNGFIRTGVLGPEHLHNAPDCPDCNGMGEIEIEAPDPSEGDE